jgi:hypothetical protein
MLVAPSRSGHNQGVKTTMSTDDDLNPEGAEGQGEVAAEAPGFGTESSRRTFLKGAALGTAAAAMYEGGALFAPLRAYADDLSGLNCTANDVRIVGPGIVLNEPCGCTGTFNAQVSFRVINNTGTQRYCVTVHFCPGANGFSPGDILIGDIPAKSDARYTVTIPNYPCGAGLVCFGACGTGTDPDTGQPDCSFAKGEGCPSGQCCTTISWDVNPGCPNKVLTSKCRHQQVCIQGRGTATLDCDTSNTGVQTTCAVECGATTTLRACTTNPAILGPFTYALSDGQTFGPTADTCHEFTVGPITANASFTVTITDKDGCATTATVNLTTSPITVELAASAPSACVSEANSDVTFTASTGHTGCTFVWKVDDAVVDGVTGATFNYPADPDNSCHTVSVVATCGNCVSSPASKTVKQCVTTSTDC